MFSALMTSASVPLVLLSKYLVIQYLGTKFLHFRLRLRNAEAA